MNSNKLYIPIRTLFTKSFGRLDFLNLFLLIPLRKMLTKRSHKHLREGRQALVIQAFDYVSNEISVDGIYEKKALETFFSWITDLNIKTTKTIAIDIGANIGNHSLYFSNYYHKVISFEPNVRTYKILSLNSELVSNIDCFNLGLSDQDKSAVLGVSKSNKGGAHILAKGLKDNSDETVNIELKKLDTFLPNLENVGLIKIDVEGHELQALKGAEGTIKKNMPVLMFEQHREDFNQGGQGGSPVLTLLGDYGYKNFAVLEKYPRVSGNFFIRCIVLPLLVIVLGDKTRIQLMKDIKPGFYEFIVALPDWFPLSKK
jgi:FkbM family methyltransferase